jgi:RNA polymerase sigma-70 factor, ECF subfamily
MDEPDPRTLRAAASGDDAAFTSIVRDTQAHVWRFLRHLLGDGELAADVTQETFVRVHRALPRFRGESRFSTWLLRIARNAALDEQRRRSRRDRTARLAQPPGPSSDGSLATELRSALANLSPELREPFILVEVFGLRYREVAEVLDAPIGTVKSRVFRARAELVSWLRTGEDGADGSGTTAGVHDG